MRLVYMCGVWCTVSDPTSELSDDAVRIRVEPEEPSTAHPRELL